MGFLDFRLKMWLNWDDSAAYPEQSISSCYFRAHRKFVLTRDAPNANRLRAQGQRLENVGSAAESAVNQHRDPPCTASTISPSTSSVEAP